MHGDARLGKKNRSRNPTNLGGGGAKGKTTTSGCHTGQHSMMPVKHVPYFYTVLKLYCSRAGVHSRSALNLTILLMLNMEYQFLKLYLLLYDLMVGSELFNDVN